MPTIAPSQTNAARTFDDVTSLAVIKQTAAMMLKKMLNTEIVLGLNPAALAQRAIT